MNKLWQKKQIKTKIRHFGLKIYRMQTNEKCPYNVNENKRLFANLVHKHFSDRRTVPVHIMLYIHRYPKYVVSTIGYKFVFSIFLPLSSNLLYHILYIPSPAAHGFWFYDKPIPLF